MPLMKGRSDKAFSHNVRAEMGAGKPLRQALAIAYANKRKYSEGGMVGGNTRKERLKAMMFGAQMPKKENEDMDMDMDVDMDLEVDVKDQDAGDESSRDKRMKRLKSILMSFPSKKL